MMNVGLVPCTAEVVPFGVVDPWPVIFVVMVNVPRTSTVRVVLATFPATSLVV
jgi:hypothetical protein